MEMALWTVKLNSKRLWMLSKLFCSVTKLWRDGIKRLALNSYHTSIYPLTHANFLRCAQWYVVCHFPCRMFCVVAVVTFMMRNSQRWFLESLWCCIRSHVTSQSSLFPHLDTVDYLSPIHLFLVQVLFYVVAYNVYIILCPLFPKGWTIVWYTS